MSQKCPGVSVLSCVTTFVQTYHTQILLSEYRCVQRCLSWVTPAVRKSFPEQQCGFSTVGSMRGNFCFGLVTSNCLIRFDAHNEQIGLNLDTILNHFLLSFFIWYPLWECNVSVGVASPNIFTDCDSWDQLWNLQGMSAELDLWAVLILWLACLPVKSWCKQKSYQYSPIHSCN